MHLKLAPSAVRAALALLSTPGKLKQDSENPERAACRQSKAAIFVEKLPAPLNLKKGTNYLVLTPQISRPD